MDVLNEITFEITNYCPNQCKYCSSDITNNKDMAMMLDYSFIKSILLYETKIDRIIISGGEPLSHPRFYDILMLCKEYTKDVFVYTNALNHICYNANVIDGIYVEANLTVTNDVDKIHILKRVEQGKEKRRPEVHFSRNFTEDCDCNHIVIKPNTEIRKSACRKEDD